MRRACLPFLLALAIPQAVHGETIYAAWLDYEAGGSVQLTRFDSETPWVLEQVIPAAGLPPGSLEFDPVTRQIWSFDYFQCQITCPPPYEPSIIDPLTGSSSFVHLPGLHLQALLGLDPDIDPHTRELRYFGNTGENFSYSLDRLELRTDEPLNPLFHVAGVAHKPAVYGASGVETYVIGRSAAQVGGTPWFELARIGGPGGDPPASSGQVTLIGAVDVEAERLWFDISANGTAYLATLIPFGPAGKENKLFRVDLESGAVEEIGVMTPPSEVAFLSGIAVAPPGLGAGALEIPAVSPLGLVAFAVLVAGLALWRVGRRSRLVERYAERKPG